MITPRRLDEISNAAQGATIDLIESDNFAIALCTHLEEAYFADEEEEEGAGWNEGVSVACDLLFVEAAKAILQSLTPSDLAALAEPMGLALVPVEADKPQFVAAAKMQEELFGGHQGEDYYAHVYSSMVEAGRIKPNQAEKGKDDE